MNILIAEDDFTSRTALAGLLKKEGHEVTSAVDGAEAWQVLQHPDAPALAILDWMMPGMDGPEVIRRVRALEKADRPTYIIMLTSKDRKADIITGLDAGANDYLVKPFDPGELRARIKVGWRMVELQEQLAAKLQELQDALASVKVLQGLIPICSSCQKIRNDEGYWTKLETYIQEHADVTFSHGICVDCLRKLYPGLSMEVELRASKRASSILNGRKADG
jgi:CheY-like chemotaxis protein